MTWRPGGSGLSRRDFTRMMVGAAATAVVAGACTSGEPTSAPPSTRPLSSGDEQAPVTVGESTALVRRWNLDQFSRGGTAYLLAGSAPEIRAAIALPIGREVFFTGEATSRQYPGTARGALESGRRVAFEVQDVSPPASRIVVIGAGMAGLAAARQLTDDGFAVTVLEGRRRLGGRIATDDTLGVPVDLGASRIIGIGDNPLMDLARSAGLRTALAPNPASSAVIRDGAEPVDSDDRDRAFRLLDDVVSEAARTGARSLAGAVEEAEALAGPDDAALVRHLATVALTNRFGGDLATLSPANLTEAAAPNGGDALVVGGMVRLLGPLSDGLDIRSGVNVLAVRHGVSPLVVETNVGFVETDHVVVTVPVAVLAAGAIRFDPPLEPERLEALAGFGIGSAAVVAARAPSRFWDGGGASIGLVAAPQSPQNWTEWRDLSTVTGAPIIVGHTAGSPATDLASFPAGDVAASALQSLGRAYR